MTTNKIEALDPALLRPGRIAYRLPLGVASEPQKLELYRRFFPLGDEFEALAFLEAHAWAETMADFQGLLLETCGRICESARHTAVPASEDKD
jgi:mitochondrial chaperone BCS1